MRSVKVSCPLPLSAVIDVPVFAVPASVSFSDTSQRNVKYIHPDKRIE